MKRDEKCFNEHATLEKKYSFYIDESLRLLKENESIPEKLYLPEKLKAIYMITLYESRN